MDRWLRLLGTAGFQLVLRKEELEGGRGAVRAAEPPVLPSSWASTAPREGGDESWGLRGWGRALSSAPARGNHEPLPQARGEDPVSRGVLSWLPTQRLSARVPELLC